MVAIIKNNNTLYLYKNKSLKEVIEDSQNDCISLYREGLIKDDRGKIYNNNTTTVDFNRTLHTIIYEIGAIYND